MRTPSKRTFENDKAVQRQVSLGPPGRRLPLPRSARVGPSAHTVEVELDDATRQELEAYIKARLAAENGGALDPDVDTMILTHIGCNALRACLPREARAAIKRFKAGDYRVIWIHNLPQQSFPATPVDGFCDERELALTNALHLGLIALVGMVPYAVPYENDGKLMRNVVPNPQAAATSSWGFRKEFFWHTDNPHLHFGEPGSNPRPFIPGFHLC